MKTTTITNGEDVTRKVHLFGPNSEPLELESLEVGEGRKQPFDNSVLDHISSLLATHGPALAKLLLIIGSAAGTIYNAIRAGHVE